jgi:hypothetical protein
MFNKGFEIKRLKKEIKDLIPYRHNKVDKKVLMSNIWLLEVLLGRISHNDVIKKYKKLL